MNCTKKCFDRLGALLAISNPNREERRYYWCNECQAYHLTKVTINSEKKIEILQQPRLKSRGQK